MPRFIAPIVLEGGAVHVDGEGTALVCAAFGARSEAQSGPQPRRDRGACSPTSSASTKVIWLEHGLEGDPAGGHVDNVACFARPGVVLALTCRDENDANYAAFQDNLARLRGERDAAGASSR